MSPVRLAFALLLFGATGSFAQPVASSRMAPLAVVVPVSDEQAQTRSALFLRSPSGISACGRGAPADGAGLDARHA